MTAATVQAHETPATADVLGLDTATAIRAAIYLDTIPDTGLRRQLAATLAAERRQELTIYRALLLERFGTAPPAAKIEADDDVYTELVLLAIA